MNIKILDSWLREYLKTNANPKQIAEILSLTSVSVEKVEKYNDDFLYEIEITTNRPDLISATGLARETASALKQTKFDAKYTPQIIKKSDGKNGSKLINIKNDPKLVNRICAVVMSINLKDSPKIIKERLESSGTRSINNIIDITNYVMKTIGHPTHVFDFDRLMTKNILIREAKLGEKITTLDEKNYSLKGKEIVAVDDDNRIIDLLGIMGLKNSVVTNDTKKILYFINNNEKLHIRNASMSLGIRTEAATINEKGIDPETAINALYYGIELFKNYADGKIESEIIDIYPNKQKVKTIEVQEEKMNTIMGINLPLKKASGILDDLGFKNKIVKNTIKATIPSYRNDDMEIEEDLIEEISRIYGYHNLPSLLPLSQGGKVSIYTNDFFWEKKAKEALKYWGFTETYTYSMVAQNLFEGPEENAVTIQNPLNEDFVYLRRTLVPSLLKIIQENNAEKEIKIFELSNVYVKRENDLPIEELTLAGIIKKDRVSFYEVKGVIEQLLSDFGIKNIKFENSSKGGLGASLYITNKYLGEIEVLDNEIINFEINFNLIKENATLKKEFKPLPKYPPIFEDLSIIVDENINTSGIISQIKNQSPLIMDVSLLDQFENSRTFHIIYQDKNKNLTGEEVSKIREKILKSLKEKFNASLKK